MPTEVRISFYKPTGFEDRHVVDTDHRGEAIRQVMDKYIDGCLGFVNYIEASLISPTEAEAFQRRFDKRDPA